MLKKPGTDHLNISRVWFKKRKYRKEMNLKIEESMIFLIKSVDDCLYQAKNSGKNRVVNCSY